MVAFQHFLCILVVVINQLSALPQQPQNPVIAIVTMPLVNCFDIAHTAPTGVDISGGCLHSYYVRWLEESGIRVVPLVWNGTWAYKKGVLDRVNGVLLPGGDLTEQDLALYIANASEIFQYALDMNKAGDRFFMWGTCQGFQVMGVLASHNRSWLTCDLHGTYPSMLPLVFTSNQPTSTLFGSSTTPPHVLRTLVLQNSTLNWHHCRLNPQDVNTQFLATFRVISTNVDVKGTPFISSMESESSNFFATQFHPERVSLQFSNDIIGHTPDDIEVSHYLSMFVAARLKLNHHSYEHAELVNAALVENYPMVNLGWGAQIFWISAPPR